VAFQYPVGWQVRITRELADEISGTFESPSYDAILAPNYHRVRFNIYDRPFEQRDVANPSTWQPNEGGFEVLWAKPITITAAGGVEFVWGSHWQQEAPPRLYAIYYSEQYELDIRLSTAMDNESLQIAKTRGFTDTVAARFAFFEHIVDNIRITP